MNSCDSYSQELNKPIICFTFDDGHLNALENAFPLFEHYAFPATSFINSGFVGKPGRVSWEQIDFLYNSAWEIGGHTIDHVELTDLSDQEAYYQINQDFINFNEHGIKLTSFALPAGHASERDYDIITSIYKNIRNSIDKQMHLPLNRLDLGYYVYQSDYKPEMVKRRIVRACTNGEALVIIGFHRICDLPTLAVDNCRPNDLDEILAWVKSNDFEVMTLEKAIDRLTK